MYICKSICIDIYVLNHLQKKFCKLSSSLVAKLASEKAFTIHHTRNNSRNYVLIYVHKNQAMCNYCTHVTVSNNKALQLPQVIAI